MLTGKKLGDALREAIKKKDVTQAQVAKAFGVQQSSVSEWLTHGRLSKKHITTLMAYFSDVAGPEYWGLPSAGEIVVSGAPRLDPLDGQEEIRQFDTGGAMGDGLVLRDQPGVIQSWKVSPEWIQKNVHRYSAVRNLAIVTGFGDSMKPMFNPGDPLLVDTAVREVEFDAVYFFRVGNEGFIKRLQRIPGEGLRVLSANRDFYEPWTVRADMDFEVFGRVVKVWRGEDL